MKILTSDIALSLQDIITQIEILKPSIKDLDTYIIKVDSKNEIRDYYNNPKSFDMLQVSPEICRASIVGLDWVFEETTYKEFLNLLSSNFGSIENMMSTQTPLYIQESVRDTELLDINAVNIDINQNLISLIYT